MYYLFVNLNIVCVLLDIWIHFKCFILFQTKLVLSILRSIHTNLKIGYKYSTQTLHIFFPTIISNAWTCISHLVYLEIILHLVKRLNFIIVFLVCWKGFQGLCLNHVFLTLFNFFSNQMIYSLATKETIKSIKISSVVFTKSVLQCQLLSMVFYKRCLSSHYQFIWYWLLSLNFVTKLFHGSNLTPSSLAQDFVLNIKQTNLNQIEDFLYTFQPIFCFIYLTNTFIFM